jgi:hypothetical protein
MQERDTRSGPGRGARWTLTRDWRGTPVTAREHVQLAARFEGELLIVEVDAPLHGDPPPSAPPGRCDGLWEHEVVELFLLGDDARYTEIELGPHGHYLVLKLHGARQLVDDRIPLALQTRIDGGRWHGRATLERAHLPQPVRAANAYAIHGVAPARRHLAAHPVPGPRPDFHRLDCFQPLRLGPAR